MYWVVRLNNGGGIGTLHCNNSGYGLNPIHTCVCGMFYMAVIP